MTGVGTTADGSGQLVYTVTVPSRFTQGAATFRAKNESGSVEATYSPTINPLVTTGSTAGSTGSEFNVRGLSFAATQPYTVTFTDNVATLQATCVATTATVSETLGTGNTSSLGSFNFKATVPDVAAGTYYVVAYDAGSNVCTVVP